jgi:hypothetical protein
MQRKAIFFYHNAMESKLYFQLKTEQIWLASKHKSYCTPSYIGFGSTPQINIDLTQQLQYTTCSLLIMTMELKN